MSNVRQALENRFSDLQHHQPDCSSITDKQLQQAIFARWPGNFQKVKIPYSFAHTNFWFNFISIRFLKYKPENIDPELLETVKETIRFTFDKWEKASNNLLEFEEVDSTLHPLQTGIFIYLAGPEAKFALDQMGAFALRRIDNDGFMQRGFIFLPNDPYLWDVTNQATWPMNTWSHEIGHTLALNHMHEYEDLKTQLQNTADGVYCSVMPYDAIIRTEVSRCKEYCTPTAAVYPGKLDIRALSLAYAEGMFADFGRERAIGYCVNAAEISIYSLLLASSHQFVLSFFKNLKLKDNQPSLPKHVSYALADLSLLGALALFDFPIDNLVVYSATSILKYLPLEKCCPEKVKEIFSRENFNIYILSNMLAIQQGIQILPLLSTLLAANSGVYLGEGVGKIGKLPAYVVNRLAQLVKPTTQAAITEVHDDNYHALEDIVIDTSKAPPVQEKMLSPTQNQLVLFRPQRRKSWCTRLAEILPHINSSDQSEESLTPTSP